MKLVFTNDLLNLQTKIVKKMDSLTSVLKGVSELEKHQKGDSDVEPMFLTWPARKFRKIGFHTSVINALDRQHMLYGRTFISNGVSQNPPDVLLWGGFTNHTGDLLFYEDFTKHPPGRVLFWGWLHKVLKGYFILGWFMKPVCIVFEVSQNTRGNVHGCFSFCLVLFLKLNWVLIPLETENVFSWRQAFTSYPHGFLSSEWPFHLPYGCNICQHSASGLPSATK